jgi:hypothetical protein
VLGWLSVRCSRSPRPAHQGAVLAAELGQVQVRGVQRSAPGPGGIRRVPGRSGGTLQGRAQDAPAGCACRSSGSVASRSRARSSSGVSASTVRGSLFHSAPRRVAHQVVYDLITQSIEVESEAEWNRKSSLEQRGIGVITASGVLVTLAFGFTTLIQHGRNFAALIGRERWLLVVSVALFVAAAIVALILNLPLGYSQLRLTRLRRMLQLPLPNDAQEAPSAEGARSGSARQVVEGESIDGTVLGRRLCEQLQSGKWSPSDIDAAVRRTVLRYELSRGFIRVLADARRINRVKAIALFVAMVLDVVAIGFLAAAAAYVVSNVKL